MRGNAHLHLGIGTEENGGATELLKAHFGYDPFLPLQEEIVRSAMAQRDTVAMPAGSKPDKVASISSGVSTGMECHSEFGSLKATRRLVPTQKRGSSPLS